jgi:hypothetical protein
VLLVGIARLARIAEVWETIDYRDRRQVNKTERTGTCFGSGAFHGRDNHREISNTIGATINEQKFGQIIRQRSA